MKEKISRWTKRPPWQKSVYEKGIILEKVVQPLGSKKQNSKHRLCLYTPDFSAKIGVPTNARFTNQEPDLIYKTYACWDNPKPLCKRQCCRWN